MTFISVVVIERRNAFMNTNIIYKDNGNAQFYCRRSALFLFRTIYIDFVVISYKFINYCYFIESFGQYRTSECYI